MPAEAIAAASAYAIDQPQAFDASEIVIHRVAQA
jgi:NADP-dependent 3-hydroxy acid dehydrogenase YdfG